MRNRTRLLMLLAPWLGALGRRAGAQPNINAPGGGPGREQIGEVQVGAGTQGDVTTGSSGPQKPAAKRGREGASSGGGSGGKASERTARTGAGDRTGHATAADREKVPGDGTTKAGAARAPSRATDATKAAR